jgi:hypothetical protein
MPTLKRTAVVGGLALSILVALFLVWLGVGSADADPLPGGGAAPVRITGFARGDAGGPIDMTCNQGAPSPKPWYDLFFGQQTTVGAVTCNMQDSGVNACDGGQPDATVTPAWVDSTGALRTRNDPTGTTAQPTRDVIWALDTSRCVNATWGTGNDGGVLMGNPAVDAGTGNVTSYPLADVMYRCTFDGSGAALCWNQGNYPFACSQTAATAGGTSRHFQGGEKDLAFFGVDAGAAAWGTVRAIDVYGLAQSGVMVMSCCPWVARAQ